MDTQGNYDDILHLPHHVSLRRKRMPMDKRAAQFAPFAALSGYEEAIVEKARVTLAKTELSGDECLMLSRRMAYALDIAGDKPVELLIVYFCPDLQKSGGEYRSVKGCVKRVDESRGSLELVDGTEIPLVDIMSVDGDVFDGFD